MNKNESKDMVKIENATRFEIVELDDMDLDAAAGGLKEGGINVPCNTTNSSQCACPQTPQST